MALEDKIGELIAAVKENTAAIKAGGKGAAAPAASGEAARGPGRPKGSTAASSKHKADDVKAALINLKTEKGSPAAKQIITDSGADDLADLLTKKNLWDGVMEAVEAAMSDGEGAAEEDEL